VAWPFAYISILSLFVGMTMASGASLVLLSALLLSVAVTVALALFGFSEGFLWVSLTALPALYLFFATVGRLVDNYSRLSGSERRSYR
jgi:hypothetical protein